MLTAPYILTTKQIRDAVHCSVMFGVSGVHKIPRKISAPFFPQPYATIAAVVNSLIAERCISITSSDLLDIRLQIIEILLGNECEQTKLNSGLHGEKLVAKLVQKLETDCVQYAS